MKINCRRAFVVGTTFLLSTAICGLPECSPTEQPASSSAVVFRVVASDLPNTQLLPGIQAYGLSCNCERTFLGTTTDNGVAISEGLLREKNISFILFSCPGFQTAVVETQIPGDFSGHSFDVVVMAPMPMTKCPENASEEGAEEK